MKTFRRYNKQKQKNKNTKSNRTNNKHIYASLILYNDNRIWGLL